MLIELATNRTPRDDLKTNNVIQSDKSTDDEMSSFIGFRLLKPNCFLRFYDKMVADKMVAVKMVRTKWYGQNGIRTKWYWTKWYEQNGTDKMVRIRLYQ